MKCRSSIFWYSLTIITSGLAILPWIWIIYGDIRKILKRDNVFLLFLNFFSTGLFLLFGILFIRLLFGYPGQFNEKRATIILIFLLIIVFLVVLSISISIVNILIKHHNKKQIKFGDYLIGLGVFAYFVALINIQNKINETIKSDMQSMGNGRGT